MRIGGSILRDRSSKVPCNLYLPQEIKDWFSENGISISQFLINSWETTVKSNTNFQACIEAKNYDYHKKMAEKHLEAFKGLTGQTNIGDFMKLQETIYIDEESQKLQSLFDAMSIEHRKMIGDPDREQFIISWIEARAPEMGINLPPRLILEKMRDNGGDIDG